MFNPDNRYTRFVQLAKITLPLIALGLLSTLFLFARGTGQSGEIPISDIEDMAREQRLSEPYFAGLATDGSQVSLSAQFARPDAEDPRLLLVNAPQLDVVDVDGVSVRISAGEGTVDTLEKVARLGGLVRLDTSNGYSMETTALTADMNAGRVVSDAALEVRAPFGAITAGQVVIETPNGEDGQQMIFHKGVRLIYHPQQTERSE